MRGGSAASPPFFMLLFIPPAVEDGRGGIEPPAEEEGGREAAPSYAAVGENPLYTTVEVLPLAEAEAVRLAWCLSFVTAKSPFRSPKTDRLLSDTTGAPLPALDGGRGLVELLFKAPRPEGGRLARLPMLLVRPAAAAAVLSCCVRGGGSPPSRSTAEGGGAVVADAFAARDRASMAPLPPLRCPPPTAEAEWMSETFGSSSSPSSTSTAAAALCGSDERGGSTADWLRSIAVTAGEPPSKPPTGAAI